MDSLRKDKAIDEFFDLDNGEVRHKVILILLQLLLLFERSLEPERNF